MNSNLADWQIYTQCFNWLTWATLCHIGSSSLIRGRTSDCLECNPRQIYLSIVITIIYYTIQCGALSCQLVIKF
jgi:hypothetical protein